MIQNLYIKILDIKINKITFKETIETIKNFLSSDKQHYLITLNPEMVVEANKDRYFKKIINEADIVLVDGVGILFANRFLNNDKLLERIKGIDLIYKICESDFIKDYKIYLLGAGEGIAKKAAKVLTKKYAHLNIVGAEEGIPKSIFNKNPNYRLQITNPEFRNDFEKLNEKLVEKINKVQPDILFVAFGASKQEKWIYENLKKMPSVKIAIGVGGSFDFISGKIRRAPRIVQRMGLEWLWRLFLEPKRIRRIYNATIKFCWLILIKNKQCD